MIKGKTSSGIGYSINEEILQDWRLQKKLTKIASFKDVDFDKEPERGIEVIETVTALELMLFGSEKAAEAFEDAVAAANDGICNAVTFQKELMEIVSANKESKN